jgi:opacity protein-like surface antigen
MKKLVSIALAACLGYGAVQAQDLMIPPPHGKAAKMGLFGGFTPGYLTLNFEPINALLKSSGIAPFDQKGAFMWGGAGAAYIMLVRNLRVGGLGMSGSASTGSSVNVAGVGAVRRDAQVQVGFGGVTVEYVVPIAERFDFAIGAMLGAGGIDIELRQSVGGIDSWNNEGKIFASWPPTSLNNSTRTLSGSYFVWIPSVSFEYAVLGWMAFRVGASYVGMSFPSWTVDSKYDLNDVPSGVSGKGFMVNAGILLGTF